MTIIALPERLLRVERVVEGAYIHCISSKFFGHQQVMPLDSVTFFGQSSQQLSPYVTLEMIYILSYSYIAMVPCANTIGLAGQEFARKIPKVVGILAETTLGSIVELILFIVLLTKDQYFVIKSAILGSILATLLLCLGLCFFVGGMRREGQQFSETVSEVGSGLLLTALVYRVFLLSVRALMVKL